jgi:hypothetical protein
MMHLLRTIHVLGGIFWVGSLIFLTFFLLPTARAVGPSGGPFINHLMQVRKLPTYMLVLGLATVLSGYWLYWHNAVIYGSAWLSSGQGKVFGMGAVLATIGWLLGFFISRPTAQHIWKLGAQIAQSGTPPTPELTAQLGRLQARMGKVSAFIAVLLVGASVAMAVARYT